MAPAEPFATLADYEGRYGEAEDPGRAELFLRDASAYVLSQLPGGWEGDPAVCANLARVTCAVAARAMERSAWPDGVESWQQTAGPFGMTVRPSARSGDMYLLASERSALGAGGSLGFAAPRRRGGRDDG